MLLLARLHYNSTFTPTDPCSRRGFSADQIYTTEILEVFSQTLIVCFRNFEKKTTF